MNTGTDEQVKKLEELIHEVTFAMLTTVETDGSLRSRPMAFNGKAGFDGDLWFFTYASSPKVDEIAHDSHVNVSFAKPESQTYVSMTGRAQLVRDPQKIEELWSPPLKAWFPEGKDDPNVALLRVRVEKAEYWDAPSSAIAHTISFVKALATGQPADPGDHAKVDLQTAV